MPHARKLFLSIVSSEFGAYRKLLADDLERPNLDVATQERFVNSGGTTLQKLDEYIRHCDAVIHVIGKATGALPQEPAVAKLLADCPGFAAKLPPLTDDLSKTQPGFSYTQWEAYLALNHHKPLYVYRPTDFDLAELKCPRGPDFKHDPAQEQSQKLHYRRLCDLGQDRGQFANEERLSSAVLRDLADILPSLESSVEVNPTKLKHATQTLIGRDDELTKLDKFWGDGHKNVAVLRAFGGTGKTALVAAWMAEQAFKDWRGAVRVFDWSFYSQGTRDQQTASGEPFIQAALEFFGDPDPNKGNAWDRGARLAKLVGRERALLVLDGLEPLQHPPGPQAGELRDPGVATLLKGLAAKNAGLCLVTTRERLPDIQQHYGKSAEDWELDSLSDEAGAALLHHVGVRRAGAKEIGPNDQELHQASRDWQGHALTLWLMGTYLKKAKHGDVRQRDTVPMQAANKQYGHAFRAMAMYEQWLPTAGVVGQQQLSILRLLGLFDRPASKGCLDALRQAPAIPGLTVGLVGLTSDDWNIAVSGLEDIDVHQGADGSLDAHPLIREYFAMVLPRDYPDGWREGHRRLYHHLCSTTTEGPTPKLPELQPLYQAIVHGCHAGSQEEALDEVYFDRICKRNEFYSARRLGAIGSDLGAVACFFVEPWSQVLPVLPARDRALLLNQAAFFLRALGRMSEARDPMRAGLEAVVHAKEWKLAAQSACNVSELELTLGHVDAGLVASEQSITYADQSGDEFERISQRTAHADALHQAGRWNQAAALFRDAQEMQAKRQPEYPLLYSMAGFRYCEVLLAEAERSAWAKATDWIVGVPPKTPHQPRSHNELGASEDVETCRATADRAATTLHWMVSNNMSLLSIAVNYLTLGRAALYEAILAGADVAAARAELDSAVAGLRDAGDVEFLVRGLLSRAWLQAMMGDRDGAEDDLNEAEEIAARGSMILFQADVHLHRARLFRDRAELEKARTLIQQCGYGRRLPELEDADAAALNWPEKGPS